MDVVCIMLIMLCAPCLREVCSTCNATLLDLIYMSLHVTHITVFSNAIPPGYLEQIAFSDVREMVKSVQVMGACDGGGWM